MNFQAISLTLTQTLPELRLARFASLAFSLSVLPFLFSLAVAQAALALATLLFLGHLWRPKAKWIAFWLGGWLRDIEFSFGSSEVLMLVLFLTTVPFVAAEIEKPSSGHSREESSASSGGVARAE